GTGPTYMSVASRAVRKIDGDARGISSVSTRSASTPRPTPRQPSASSSRTTRSAPTSKFPLTYAMMASATSLRDIASAIRAVASSSDAVSAAGGNAGRAGGGGGAASRSSSSSSGSMTMSSSSSVSGSVGGAIGLRTWGGSPGRGGGGGSSASARRAESASESARKRAGRGTP